MRSGKGEEVSHHTLQLERGVPGSGVDFNSHIIEALADPKQTSVRLRAGFAYATRVGVQDLIENLEPQPGWTEIPKHWLVGVHHGISEPVAIQTLRDIPNSHVRLAVCNLPMQDAIFGRRVFHAKVVAINSGQDDVLSTLVAGSANLTGSAMGTSARNFEFGIAYRNEPDANLSTHFNSWWNEAWGAAKPATTALITEYIKHRDSFLKENPDVLIASSIPAIGALQDAQMLWIEAGSMSGGSRNQVEFSEHLAAFFGPVSTKRRFLTIAVGQKEWNDRPLSPKVTSLDVGIWRLSLPTLMQSGFEYPGRTICFFREEVKGGTRFRIDVADSAGEKAYKWRERSHKYGFVGRTGGSRSYGFA